MHIYKRAVRVIRDNIYGCRAGGSPMEGGGRPVDGASLYAGKGEYLPVVVVVVLLEGPVTGSRGRVRVGDRNTSLK